MKRGSLMLVLALLCSACASRPSVPPGMLPDGTGLAGKWIGTWRSAGSGDVIMRQDTLRADFSDDGRGKMVWSGVNVSGLPEEVVLAGAIGVPVIVQVRGSVIKMEHAFGDLSVRARFEMRAPDELVGRMVGTRTPVELVLMRQPPDKLTGYASGPSSSSSAASNERLERLEKELAQERARLNSILANVSDLHTRTDAASRAAETAIAVAQRAAATAESAPAGATVAAPVTGSTGEPLAAAAGAPQMDNRMEHATPRRQIKLIDVGFRFNKWDLDDTAETALLEIIDMLKQDQTLMADLEGYTDSVGSVGYNVQLSQRRVEQVQRFLAKKGVPLSQMHFVGFGPIRDDGSSEEQARNRRVTVRLMGEEPKQTSAIQPEPVRMPAPQPAPIVVAPAPMPVSATPAAPAPAAETPSAQTAASPAPQTPEPATPAPQPDADRPAASANETPAADPATTVSGSTK